MRRYRLVIHGVQKALLRQETVQAASLLPAVAAARSKLAAAEVISVDVYEVARPDSFGTWLGVVDRKGFKRSPFAA